MKRGIQRIGLHRTGGKAEWDTLPHVHWNAWQRIAAATHSTVTPGNVITMSGFALTLAGLVAITKEHYWFGLGGVGVGRLLDVADGWAAEHTGTKSPLGEALDAGLDKVATIAAAVALLLAHIAPWWVLLLLLLPHIAISIVGAVWLWHGHHLHPSRRGKISMALAWVGLGGLVLAAALQMTSQHMLVGASYACVAASVVIGFMAVGGYRNIAQPWKH